MKKGIFLLLFFVQIAALALAQPCKRDSSILQLPDSILLLPRPYAPSYPFVDTKPVCINEPYLQDATLKLLDTVTVPGFGMAGLDKIEIAATGAITNLPTGLSYTCDPPNCVFEENTLGCIQIKGTATAANALGQRDVGIKLKVFTTLIPGFGIDLTFPGSVAPNSHFYLDVRAQGQCTISADDLDGTIGSVKNAPNPFTGSTQIMVESLVNGDFTFEVFDLVGQRLHTRPIRLFEGSNSFEFDANGLAAGSYFYSIGNAEGKITKTLTIVK